MKRTIITSGTVFGMLTVIKEGEDIIIPSGQVNRTILCRCECGNEKTIRLLHLSSGRIRSCGCLSGERHGGSDSSIYRVWAAIKWRCSEVYFEKHLYFDRGISVCEEWKDSFIAFREFAISHGYKKGLQIDREDNDKGYYPDNCRFVTRIVNMSNRRNTVRVIYKGKEIPIMTILRRKGLVQRSKTIIARINCGWDADRAINTPIRKGNYR